MTAKQPPAEKAARKWFRELKAACPPPLAEEGLRLVEAWVEEERCKAAWAARLLAVEQERDRMHAAVDLYEEGM